MRSHESCGLEPDSPGSDPPTTASNSSRIASKYVLHPRQRIWLVIIWPAQGATTSTSSDEQNGQVIGGHCASQSDQSVGSSRHTPPTWGARANHARGHESKKDLSRPCRMRQPPRSPGSESGPGHRAAGNAHLIDSPTSCARSEPPTLHDPPGPRLARAPGGRPLPEGSCALAGRVARSSCSGRMATNVVKIPSTTRLAAITEAQSGSSCAIANIGWPVSRPESSERETPSFASTG